MEGSPVAEEKIPPDVAKLSFEEALSRLEKIVRQLEEGKGGLEESIKAYERGAQLKRHCEAKLREAQLKVEKIVLGPGGGPGEPPSSEPQDFG
jgi:exodeoxyribonuclease VII small subunit